ncbi:DinB family protein [Niabella sp. 22666]|uniref:DinB family protein n=1 Tax=Niabella sp. 22666 TaxID=3453954 RepID=UPI003F84CF5E
MTQRRVGVALDFTITWHHLNQYHLLTQNDFTYMNKEWIFSDNIKVYASKDTVWKVLLSARFYQLSWGAKLSTTWQTGSPIQFAGVWENVEYIDKGVIQDVKERCYLKFSYWSSFWNTEDVPEEYCVISFSLSQIDDYSCNFTITQEGFRDEIHYNDTVELWKNTGNILKYQAEKDELVSINNQVFNDLFAALRSMPEDTYNKEVPDKWNPAQIVEHIIMGNGGMKQFLTEGASMSDTPYDLHIEAIRDLMNNKEVQYQSPDFLVPALKIYDRQEQKEILAAIRSELNECIFTLDFDKKCGTAEMKPFGCMSTYEWLNFSVFHILRHAVQLKSYAQ